MGLSIGAAARAIASIAPAGLNRSDRGAASNSSPENSGQLVRPEEPPEIRAGFGENTLSPSGAALKTLDSNLKAAEQLVPTVEELRDRARAAQAARDVALEARAEATRPEEFRRREFVRPEPNPSARFFVQDEDAVARPAPTAAIPPEAAAEPSLDQPAPPTAFPNSPISITPANPAPGARLDLQA